MLFLVGKYCGRCCATAKVLPIGRLITCSGHLSGFRGRRVCDSIFLRLGWRFLCRCVLLLQPQRLSVFTTIVGLIHKVRRALGDAHDNRCCSGVQTQNHRNFGRKKEKKKHVLAMKAKKKTVCLENRRMNSDIHKTTIRDEQNTVVLGAEGASQNKETIRRRSRIQSASRIFRKSIHWNLFPNSVAIKKVQFAFAPLTATVLFEYCGSVGIHGSRLQRVCKC